jgi:hypothetical protein
MKRNEDDGDFGFGSPMHDAAVSVHEMYETLKSAGFSRKDSLELVGKILVTIVTSAMEGATNDEEEDEDY